MDQKNSKYAYILALSALGIKESFHESHQVGVISANKLSTFMDI